MTGKPFLRTVSFSMVSVPSYACCTGSIRFMEQWLPYWKSSQEIRATPLFTTRLLASEGETLFRGPA